MDTKKNRRHQLLRIIETLFDGKSGQCADALGIKRPQLSRWITTNEVARHGISEDAARSIEKKLGLQVGTLDDDLNATSIERVTPQVPADLLVAWDYLLPGERADLAADIKRRAAHNQAVGEMLAAKPEAKSPPKMPATAVSAGPPSAHAKKPGHRRTGT